MNVNPELYHWALERSGLSVVSLARKFPKLADWQAGRSAPTLRQLESLARSTWTPLGYFFLPEPPVEELGLTDFRTMSDRPVARPSPNLLDTVFAMRRRQEWLREELTDQGQSPLPFVGSISATHSPEQLAGEIRKALGLGEGWASKVPNWSEALRFLREAAEDAGILVVFNGVVGNDTTRKLQPEEFRGFVLVDEYAPLIFVNGADAKSAQMFTLAHELAHVWIGQGGIFDLPDLRASDAPSERLCNRAAAELLVTAKEFAAFWPQIGHSGEPFEAAARHFKVSPIVAARRAFDLGFVERDRFLRFLRQNQARERLKGHSPGGNFFNNQNVRVGKRFARAVARAAQNGRLLYRDAYRLTGLYGSTFDKYLSQVGD